MSFGLWKGTTPTSEETKGQQTKGKRTTCDTQQNLIMRRVPVIPPALPDSDPQSETQPDHCPQPDYLQPGVIKTRQDKTYQGTD